jgi:hypothetical protein
MLRVIVGFPPTSLRSWLAKASVTLGFCMGILTKKKVLDFRNGKQRSFWWVKTQ